MAAPERHVVVVGASAGGLECLVRIAGDLSPDLPASVFVVLHVSPGGPSALPAILSRSGRLPAEHARDGEAIEPGRIYVAPPDHHLLLEPGVMRLVQGPRENRVRPAIDVLFRSAAAVYGPRVIGVVMSGYLDDGATGLLAIKRQGGIAVVQDPDDAQAPAMPRAALALVEADHVVPLSEAGALIDHLVRASHDRPGSGHRPPPAPTPSLR
jgi:two-component system chemotaxis response regulator CheB